MTDYFQIAAEIESLLLPEGRLDPTEVEQSQRRRLKLALALEAHRTGYEVVAVDAVADAAMLSKATLYSLFVSKKGLLAAAVTEFSQMARAAAESAIQASAGGHLAVTAAMRALLDVVVAEPALARLTFVEAPAVLTDHSRGGEDGMLVEGHDIALVGAILDAAMGVSRKASREGEDAFAGLARQVTLAGMVAPIADRLIDGRKDAIPALHDSLVYVAITAQRGPKEGLKAVR